MHKVRLLALSIVVLLASFSSSSADIEVSFDQPERFTDAGLYSSRGSDSRAATVSALRQHLEALGARHLSANQKLRLEILDIDLAGQYEPWRTHAHDVRVMRDVTWPRIEVRYVLEQDGRIVRQDKETIKDMHYLSRADAQLRNDPLRYEKSILNEWFVARFVEVDRAAR
jgi:hypothetical protein